MGKRGRGLFSLAAALLLPYLFWSSPVLFGAGCSCNSGVTLEDLETDDDDDAADDETEEEGSGTSDQALLAGESVATLASTVAEQLFPALRLRPPPATRLKAAISSTPAEGCEAGSPPADGVAPITIPGEAGSCSGTTSLSGTGGTIRLTCTDYDTGNGAVINGTIGTTLSEVEGGLQALFGSEDLTMTAGGISCPVGLNLTVTIAEDSAWFAGCLEVCGSSFTLSGTEEEEEDCPADDLSYYEVFFADECNWDWGELTNESTLSYDHMIQLRDGFGVANETILCALQGACQAGDSGCLTYANSYQVFVDCGLVGDGEDQEEEEETFGIVDITITPVGGGDPVAISPKATVPTAASANPTIRVHFELSINTTTITIREGTPDDDPHTVTIGETIWINTTENSHLVTNVSFDYSANETVMTITFNEVLVSGRTYLLQINNVSDGSAEAEDGRGDERIYSTNTYGDPLLPLERDIPIRYFTVP